MKLIGVKGKSGSGKTTFARMLKKDDTIGIINLDQVSDMKMIKEKMPKSIVEKEVYTNNLGEEYTAFSKRIVTLIDKVKKNKFLSEIYYYLADSVRNFGVRREIKRNVKQGKDFIIIERGCTGKLKGS